MLNQTAIYALRAMGYLATKQDEGPVLSQTISDEMAIPKNFLSKIMHRLVQAGLVTSIRGTNGGFVLAKKAEEISMRDVVSNFMKLDDFDDCFLGFSECRGSCGIHDRWNPIAGQITKLLDDTSINEML